MTDTLQSGRFVLLRPLGRGTQGHTFEGRDEKTGEAVAIKRFDVHGARRWKDAELAEREARVLRSLSHPRLPSYIDHFEEDGALYLVMEKIEGETLASIRARGGTLSERDVLRLLGDASDVLDYLHGRAPPIVHRDLKPGNVIRLPDGSFAFVDFGAVKDKLRPEGGSTVVGTFGYMAPEQFQGRALPASDVYAIGATAMSMLTGKEPEHLPHRGLAIDVRAALRGRASVSLVQALARMLDPDPDRRAPRIAPLVGPLVATAGRGGARGASAFGCIGIGDGAAAWAASSRVAPLAHREAWKYVRRASRQAWKAERRASREAWKAERRARRDAAGGYRLASDVSTWAGGHAAGMRRPVWPWFVVLVMTFGLIVATVAVSVTLRALVPAVLLILSLFVAPRGLRRAAARVRGSGGRAVAALRRARGWVHGAPWSSPDESSAGAGRRVDAAADPSRAMGNRLRVDGDTGARVASTPTDDDAEIEAADMSERDRAVKL